MRITEEIKLLRLALDERLGTLLERTRALHWADRESLDRRLFNVEQKLKQLESVCPGVRKYDCPHASCADPTHITPNRVIKS